MWGPVLAAVHTPSSLSTFLSIRRELWTQKVNKILEKERKRKGSKLQVAWEEEYKYQRKHDPTRPGVLADIFLCVVLPAPCLYPVFIPTADLHPQQDLRKLSQASLYGFLSFSAVAVTCISAGSAWWRQGTF